MARTGGGRELPVPDSIPTADRIEADFDDFTDETPVGSGGNADVYRARYPGSGPDTVALKQPRFAGTIDTAGFDRFLKEAETWSKLDDHDHIVGVLDWGSEPLPWIALEYMDGDGLEDRLGEISTAEALWIGICVCRAVRHAHRRGIAHLDLKPENVLFRQTPPGRYDAPKVTDWGLAKMLLEHSGSIEGLSPQYAAPEQFGDGSPDDFTDIYQTGAVVYAALTGRPPFEGDARAVMGDVLSSEPEPPSEIADIPSIVDEPILTALSKDKPARQESILDLRRDLGSCLDELEDGSSTDSTGSNPAGTTESVSRHREDGSTTDSPNSGSAGTTESASYHRKDGSTTDTDSSRPSKTTGSVSRHRTPTRSTEEQTARSATASGTETNIDSGNSELSALNIEPTPELSGLDTSAESAESRPTEESLSETEVEGVTDVDTGRDTHPIAPGHWHYVAAGSLLLMFIGFGAGIDVFSLFLFVFLYAFNRDLKELTRAENVEWTPKRWLWLFGLFVYPVALPYYFYKRWKKLSEPF